MNDIEPVEKREELRLVNGFAILMLQKLGENRHKGGWQDPPDELLDRLREEVCELEVAIDALRAVENIPIRSEQIEAAEKELREHVAREAADVGNFAAFIVDVVLGMPKLEEVKEGGLVECDCSRTLGDRHEPKCVAYYHLWKVAQEQLVGRNEAIELALEHGSIDGAHHKTWVIDQMLRKLAGDRYDEVVNKKYQYWETGTAP